MANGYLHSFSSTTIASYDRETCKNLIRSSASVNASILRRYPIIRRHAGSCTLERN